jgi:hypothetical protein
MENRAQNIPRDEILVDNRVIPLMVGPFVPDEAYPPVIEGEHPLMIVDDFALDLSGGDGPSGYSGTWVLREGALYLRWYLGWSHVKWDVKASWFTGDLRLDDSSGSQLMHVENGIVDYSQAA